MNKDNAIQSIQSNPLNKQQKRLTQSLAQQALPLIGQQSIKQSKQYAPTWKFVLGYSIIVMAITGGALFTIGSVVLLPSINWGLVGAWCFIIGSAQFTLCQIFSIILQPSLSPTRCFQSIASLKTLLNIIGNFNFIIGSVFFIPKYPQIVGIDIFVIGSAFLWIPQIATCWGLYLCNHYTSEFYFAFFPFRRTVIFMNLCTGFGCLFFVVGCVLFNNKDQQSEYFFVQAVGLFIAGSFLFLLAPIIGLRMRMQRLTDPLWKHHQSIRSMHENR